MQKENEDFIFLEFCEFCGKLNWKGYFLKYQKFKGCLMKVKFVVELGNRLILEYFKKVSVLKIFYLLIVEMG